MGPDPNNIPMEWRSESQEAAESVAVAFTWLLYGKRGSNADAASRPRMYDRISQ